MAPLRDAHQQTETETPTLTPTETGTATPTETPTPPPGPLEGHYNWHYTYDGLSRLTYACSDWDSGTSTCNGHEFHYAYDGAGNTTRFDRWNSSTNQVETVRYLYNGANQIKCVDSDASGACDGSEFVWQYDAYGNLLNDGTATYTYDAANRLASVTNASGTTSYTYNGDGDRISQTVNGTLTTYTLETATLLTMVLAETSNGQTIHYWQGLDLLAQSDGTTTAYFTYDGLGSVRQLTDPAGVVQLAQTFDAYGNGYSKSGSVASSFGYTGEQQDANGFVYLRARYYNPAQGRFTQMDPSRKETNPYSYAAQNPVTHIDPVGLQSEELINATVVSSLIRCDGDILDIPPDYTQVACTRWGVSTLALGTVLPGNRILTHGHWGTERESPDYVLRIKGIYSTAIFVRAEDFFRQANWALTVDNSTITAQLPFDIAHIGDAANTSVPYYNLNIGMEVKYVHQKPEGCLNGLGALSDDYHNACLTVDSARINELRLQEGWPVFLLDKQWAGVGGDSGGGAFISDSLVGNHWGLVSGSLFDHRPVKALVPWMRWWFWMNYGSDC